MVSEQRHEMQLAMTHPSGAEEWMCPECGRRFVAEWEPKFRRVFLERGQDETVHVGHGMRLLTMGVDRSEGESPADDRLQDIWKKYLDKLDFDLKDDHNPADPPVN